MENLDQEHENMNDGNELTFLQGVKEEKTEREEKNDRKLVNPLVRRKGKKTRERDSREPPEEKNENKVTIHLQVRESIFNVMTKIHDAIEWSRDAFIHEQIIGYLRHFLCDIQDQENAFLESHVHLSLEDEDVSEDLLHDITVTLHSKVVAGVTKLACEIHQGVEQYIEIAVTYMVGELMTNIKNGDFTFLSTYYNISRMERIIQILLAEFELIQ